MTTMTMTSANDSNDNAKPTNQRFSARARTPNRIRVIKDIDRAECKINISF